MIDEEFKTDEVVDPADDEVEVEDEDAEGEFAPEKVEQSEEEVADEGDDLGDEGGDDEVIEDEVPLAEGAEPSASDLAEVDESELGKYKVTGLVDYTDEQGNIRGQLPIDSIQEVPVALGDSWVEAGQAEKVQ